MHINPINVVTCTCPLCNTAVRFDVSSDNAELTELFKSTERLVCPRCQNDMSTDLATALRAVKKYNDSINNLLSVQEVYNIEVG